MTSIQKLQKIVGCVHYFDYSKIYMSMPPKHKCSKCLKILTPGKLTRDVSTIHGALCTGKQMTGISYEGLMAFAELEFEEVFPSDNAMAEAICKIILEEIE